MTTANLLSALLRARTAAATGALVATALLAQGCLERQLHPIAPCATSRVQQHRSVAVVDQVDLLFLIDNSGSMAAEQAALTQEIRGMVDILTTGERAVSSLHVGVISSDMGIGAAPTAGACLTGVGRDGLLFAPSETHCGGSESAILAFSTESDDDRAAFADRVSCVATLGDQGCHYEQPLEAILKALSPSTSTDFTAPGYEAPLFFGQTLGHGGPDGDNAGFLRAGAVLAIVLITDEDDCSAEDPAYFEGVTSSETHCAEHRDGQWAVDRYVTGLLGLRPDPSQIVFSAIVGIPESLAGHSEAEILDDAEMTATVEDGEVRRVCTFVDENGQEDPTRGDAAPARRIVQVAQGLHAAGASTSVQSICTGNYHDAMNDVVARIGGALGTACLPRPLNLDANGEADCDVFQLLPAVESPAELTHCADLPGATAYTLERVETSYVGGETMHRELCRMQQVVRGAADATGWYYDDGSAAASGPSAMPHGCGQGVAFAGVRPVSGAVLRVECSEELFPSTGSVVQLGSFCDPGTGADGSGVLAESSAHTCGMGIATPGFETSHMTCDAFDRTCQVSCDDDSDCAAGGLLGYACDTREAREVFGTHLPAGLAPTAVHGFCVNPTCHED